MPSVFTRIIDGELPGRFVWRDDHVVAFLDFGRVERDPDPADLDAAAERIRTSLRALGMEQVAD